MKKGFTILEMLIVVTILSVLMVAGFVSFAKVRNNIVVKSASREICSALRVTRSYAIAKGKDYPVELHFITNSIRLYETSEFMATHRLSEGVDLLDGDGNDVPNVTITYHANGTVGSRAEPKLRTFVVRYAGKERQITLYEGTGRVKVE